MQQDRRYNQTELEIIKATFKDQEGLCILIRRYLLQDDLNPDESKYLKQHTDNPSILAILKKTINPELDKKAPIHQTVDLFSGMDLQPTQIDHAVLSIKARKRAWEYLNQQFNALAGLGDDLAIRFDKLVDPDGKTNEQAYIDFVARNFLLGYIDTQGLRQLLVLASLDETPGQKAERLAKNSNK